MEAAFTIPGSKWLFLVSARERGRITAWDAVMKRMSWRLPQPLFPFYRAAATPDGARPILRLPVGRLDEDGVLHLEGAASDGPAWQQRHRFIQAQNEQGLLMGPSSWSARSTGFKSSRRDLPMTLP